MSDALPLPPRPTLQQYDELAKDIQAACKSGVPGAIGTKAARWAEEIARVRHPESLASRWGEPDSCELKDAQLFVARIHGFANWPAFAAHLEALANPNSAVSTFEMAVDAIVSGDEGKLIALLQENPELVHARSTRQHGSTLLHYVSANGVEDFRQKTPGNIVAIAESLLRAGANVNAESDAYGGRATTLGLTATSCHPENAGVQLALLDLLILHGALLDGPDGASSVNACLRNGRGQAAEFLAGRGALLDLEGACGTGGMDAVQRFLDGASRQQLLDGFAWACQFGWTAVVDFLLLKGVPVDAKLRHHGQTGLHWAAFGGHPDTVRLLVDRGAPLDPKDDCYGATPLEWALYACGTAPRASFYDVVAQLVRAGAVPDTQWYEGSAARMQAALRGEN